MMSSHHNDNTNNNSGGGVVSSLLGSSLSVIHSPLMSVSTPGMYGSSALVEVAHELHATTRDNDNNGNNNSVSIMHGAPLPPPPVPPLAPPPPSSLTAATSSAAVVPTMLLPPLPAPARALTSPLLPFPPLPPSARTSAGAAGMTASISMEHKQRVSPLSLPFFNIHTSPLIHTHALACHRINSLPRSAFNWSGLARVPLTSLRGRHQVRWLTGRQITCELLRSSSINYRNLNGHPSLVRLSILAKAQPFVVIILSILNTIISLIGTAVSVNQSRSFRIVVYVIRLLSLLLFTTEFGLRLWSCVDSPRSLATRSTQSLSISLWRLRFRWLIYGHNGRCNLSAVIDLFCLISLLINVTIPVRLYGIAHGTQQMLRLQLLNMLPMICMLRLERLSGSLLRLYRIFRIQRGEFLLVIFTSLCTVFIVAIAMYFIEHDSQPTIFSSVAQSLWFATNSLTLLCLGRTSSLHRIHLLHSLHF
jgi:hypothetical protein